MSPQAQSPEAEREFKAEIGYLYRLLDTLTEEMFNRIWIRLEVTGACDGLGGTEYNRVFQEWRDKGSPTNGLMCFIREECNK